MDSGWASSSGNSSDSDSSGDGVRISSFDLGLERFEKEAAVRVNALLTQLDNKVPMRCLLWVLLK